MKVIILDPNLKNSSGHCYEAMKAIYNSISTLCNVEYYLIAHKNLAQSVALEFEHMFPLAQVSCFETTDYCVVYKYIKALINKFNLSENDLLVVMTAHINELKAIAQISNEPNAPNFLIQVHQFFPPLIDSDLIEYDKNIKNQLSIEFERSFASMNWDKVVVGTTLVRALNDKLSLLAHRRLAMLPVPFFIPDQDSERIFNNIKLRLGFFGDNRKEKGTLLFLRAIKNILSDNTVEIFINFQSPRCYVADEENEIKDLVSELEFCSMVTVIKGAMSSNDYHCFLGSCDLVILPYYPAHYGIRMSGIAIECGIAGVAVLASDDTSIATLIRDRQLAGTIFKFSPNQSEFSENLCTAIKQAKKHLNDHRVEAESFKRLYRSEYSANNFLNNYVLKFNELKTCKISSQ